MRNGGVGSRSARLILRVTLLLRATNGRAAIPLNTDCGFVGAPLAAPFLGQGKPFDTPAARPDPIDFAQDGPVEACGELRRTRGGWGAQDRPYPYSPASSLRSSQ